MGHIVCHYHCGGPPSDKYHCSIVKAGSTSTSNFPEAGELEEARKRVPNPVWARLSMACSRLSWLAATISGLLIQATAAQDTWCGKVYNGYVGRVS